MDTLTFDSPILLRHLTYSEAKKMPISEIRLDKALEGLGMNMPQVRMLKDSVSVETNGVWLLCSSSSCAFYWDVIIWSRSKELAPSPP